MGNFQPAQVGRFQPALTIVSLEQVRARRLPVPYVPPAQPSILPQERMVAAADLSMADKAERWASSLVDDLMRFNRALTAPQRRDLMRVIAIIDSHPL